MASTRAKTAESYFGALVGHALARAKAAPKLRAVESLHHLDLDRPPTWLLHFALPGEDRVVVEAQAAGEELHFHYRSPPPSPRQRRLERAGLLLCRALAATGAPPPHDPAPLRPAAEPSGEASREGLFLYLPGECDRSCRFCTIHLEPPPAVELGLGDRVRGRLGLPMRHELSPDPRPALEATLRDHADRADQLGIAWSGRDCLASPLFDDLLRLAHELGYRDMTIQTPGTRLLEPGCLEFLAAHGIQGIGLTAHADDEATFDRINGKPGAARMFWATLAALDATQFRVSVEVPLIAETAEGLARLLPRLLEHRCGPTVFYWYPEATVTAHFGQLALPYAEAIAALERAAEGFAPDHVGLDGIPACVAPEHLRNHYRWLYGRHMDSAATKTLDQCQGCALADTCPGAAVVYLDTYGWPADSRPIGPAPAPDQA